MPFRTTYIAGKRRGASLVVALSLGLLAAAPATADVRAGVDAWSRGDYAAAVAEWEGPAAAGDPDAMFNLAQAYRLGRGVPIDLARAETLYAAAADAGHLQAADTYGLLLFQDGRRAQALPYVMEASARGDARAHYLLGIGHFNGDMLERDWERAYALMTLANAAGMPQAGPALAEMDRHIPLGQRQSAAALARRIDEEATRLRSTQLAAADLAIQSGDGVTTPRDARSRPAAPQTVGVSPSIAAAQDAVLQARQATGTADPADAGASYARGPATARPAMAARTPQPDRTATPARAPAPQAAPASAQPSTPAVATTAARDLTAGPWKIQLGAFGVAGNAERLWNRLSTRQEISGRARLLVPTGRVTRLLAGGYASRAEAQRACDGLRRSGQECLVTRT